jgi:hypothetical protein
LRAPESKFTDEFGAVLGAGPVTPNLNADTNRWVRIARKGIRPVKYRSWEGWSSAVFEVS